MSFDLRTAIRDALADELRADHSVVLFGEDVAAAGGVFKATPGLVEEFGDRVFDTPISELALAGAAFGSAVTGLRPVIEIMFGDFVPLTMDSLINQAAKFWYVSNEQAGVPLVLRCAVGAGGRFGAMHSQSPGTWLHGVPGLKVVAPAFPADAYVLLRAAIRDRNPVIFLEHKRLYPLKGEPGDCGDLPIGRARVVRPGADLTVVSIMKGVHDALAAADVLAAAGVDCEVVDLRGLRPLDAATVAESVSRTGRLLAVEEGTLVGGWAAGLVGIVAEQALGDLDDLWVLATDDTPVPYSPTLEDAYLPGADAIVASVRKRLSVAAG